MIGRKWTNRTVLMSADFVEDPTLHRDDHGLFLYYSRGPHLQDQRIHYRRAETPRGPLGEERRSGIGDTHTRIERARVWDDQWLHTASWPGPPTGGIMAFGRNAWGTTRSLVLTVQPGTGWSFIAANPCVERRADGTVDIIFEGCTDKRCHWRLFLAHWTPGSMAVVEPEPLMDGANPSTFVENGTRYLTYSRLTDAGYSAGFETCVMEQPA